MAAPLKRKLHRMIARCDDCGGHKDVRRGLCADCRATYAAPLAYSVSLGARHGDTVDVILSDQTVVAVARSIVQGWTR